MIAPATVRSNFLKVWVGQGVSEFGTQMSALAIPTLAIIIYHATPFQASVAGALGVAPYALFSLPAGPLADRLPRRAVIVVCDAGRAVAVGSLAATFLLGYHHMWVVYAVEFALGVFTVFFDITFMSFLPQVVPGDRLLSANSRLSATSSVAGTAGPSIAGLVIEWLGPARTLIVDSLSYVVSALAVLLVRVEHPRRPPRTRGLRTLYTEIREGIAYVFGTPVLARVALTNAVCDFGQSMIKAVYMVFVFDSLHLGPGVVGFVMAVEGVSFTIGAVLLPRVVRRFGFGRTMAFSILLGMAVELVTPVALLGFAVAILMGIKLVTGATNAWYDVNQLTYRQRLTPDELQGRVHATMRMTFAGPTPFGYLLGGALATGIGVATTLFLGAVVSTAGATLMLTAAVLRLRTIDQVDEADQDEAESVTSAASKETS
jgi:MFS family permease